MPKVPCRVIDTRFLLILVVAGALSFYSYYLLNNSTNVSLSKRLSTRRRTRTVEYFNKRQMSGTANKRLQFIHIPKTGGSSVENYAQKRKIKFGRWAFAGRTQDKMRQVICEQSRDYCPDKATWHIPFQRTARALLNATEFALYNPNYNHSVTDYFCVVRDPFLRAISEYYFVLLAGVTAWTPHVTLRQYNWTRRHGRDPQDACTAEALNDFIQIVIRNILNGNLPKCWQNCHWVAQYEFIYDLHGKRVCNYVFNLEQIKNYALSDQMFERYGLNMSLRNMDKENSGIGLRFGHRCKQRLGVDSLTDETRRLIEQMFPNDLQFGNKYDSD